MYLKIHSYIKLEKQIYKKCFILFLKIGNEY